MKSATQLSILAGLATASLALFTVSSEKPVEAAASNVSFVANDAPKALAALLSAQSFTPGDSTTIAGSRGALVLKAKKSSLEKNSKKSVPDKFSLKLKKPDGSRKKKKLSADALYKKAGKLDKKKKSKSDAKLTKTYPAKKKLGKTSKKFSLKVKMKDGKATDFKVTSKKTR
jgi:hypothetical protein